MRRLIALILPLLAVALLSGCGGLSSEPPIVTTLIPSTPVPPTSIPPTAQPAATNAAGVPGVQNAPASPTAGTVVSEVLGIAKGQIANLSAGGTVPRGLTITLLMSDTGASGATNVATRTTTTTASGEFEFRDIPIRTGWVYGATTEYKGRTISGEAVSGNPAQTTLTLPLSIYETTSDPGVLSVSSLITQIIAEDNGLQVAQVLHFTNNSDRMFTTESKLNDKQFASITLQVPKNAQVMGFMDSSGRFVLSSDGKTISDTTPVLPKEDHVFHYIYTLPYTESGTSVEQPLSYGVNGPAHFIVQPNTVALNSSQVFSMNVQSDASSGSASYVGMVNLKAGDTFRYDLRGSTATNTTTNPAATTSQSTAPISRDLLTGLLIGGGFGLIVVGGLFLLRDARGSNRPRPRPQVAASLSPEKAAALNADRGHAQHLIAQLAQLDQRYEAGQISQESYEKKRQNLKGKLAELMEEA